MTMKPDRQPTRRQFIAATAGVVAGATVTSTPVVAEHNAPPGGVFADGFATSRNFRAFFRGVRSRYSGLGPPADVETLVDRAVNEFRAHEASWLAYGDWAAQEHGLSPLGDSTIAIDFEITRGRWPTRDESVATTLTAAFDTETETYESVTWEVEPTDDPDYEAILQNRAAENAADELQTFRREWIGDPDLHEPGHELPGEEYISVMAGRYSSSIQFGEETENVLELLLGGFEV